MVSRVSTAVLALVQLPVPGKRREWECIVHLKLCRGVGCMKLWAWGAGADPQTMGLVSRHEAWNEKQSLTVTQGCERTRESPVPGQDWTGLCAHHGARDTLHKPGE